MRKTRIKGIAAVAVALSMIAACSDDDKKSDGGSDGTTAADCAEVTPVKLQLQWV